MENGATWHYLDSNAEGCPGGQNADPEQWEAARRAARWRSIPLKIEKYAYCALLHILAAPFIVLFVPVCFTIAPCTYLLGCFQSCCGPCCCCSYCADMERLAESKECSVFAMHCLVPTVVLFLFTVLLAAYTLVVLWLPVALSYCLCRALWARSCTAMGRRAVKDAVMRPRRELCGNVEVLRIRYKLDWTEV